MQNNIIQDKPYNHKVFNPPPKYSIKKNTIIGKILAWFIVLWPILSMYISPIEGMDFFTFTLMGVFLLCLPFLYTRKIRLKKIHYILVVYFAYVFFFTLINLFLAELFVGRTLILMRMLRFLMNAVVVFILAWNFVDFDYLMRVFRKFCLICTVYIVLQTVVFYSFRIILPPFINSLTRVDYSHVLYTGVSFFRPTSFFFEPAHYSEIMILALTYCLFRSKFGKKPLTIEAMFLTLGLILSTSGIGILAAVFLWLVAVAYRVLIAKDKKQKIIYVGVLALMGIATIVLMQIPMFQQTIYRLNQDGLSAMDMRFFGGIGEFSSLSSFGMIFGSGFGNIPQRAYLYFAGIPYVLFTHGILGSLLFFALLVYVFIKARGFAKIFIILFVLIFIGSDILTHFFNLYLVFILLNSKNANKLRLYLNIPVDQLHFIKANKVRSI